MKRRNIKRLASLYTLKLLAFFSLTFLGCNNEEREKNLQVLVVTGVDIEAHNWEETTAAIAAELGKVKNLEVDVLKDIYTLGEVELSSYDVLYLNFNNWGHPDPDAGVTKKLLEFVAHGGGLVVAHFASGSFETWPDFIKISGRVWDRVNTHDPRGPFLVEIVDTTHPITRDVRSFTTDDELYTCLTGNEPIHLLAQARSVVTGLYHPMAFILTYEKGRIFHIALGHDAKAIHVEGTADLIRNGTTWAGKRLD